MFVEVIDRIQINQDGDQAEISIRFNQYSEVRQLKLKKVMSEFIPIFSE